MSQRLMSQRFKDDPLPLTPREAEMLGLMVKDCMKTHSITAKLGISVKTVETHRSNLMRKLRVHSIAQLCRAYWTKKEGI